MDWVHEKQFVMLWRTWNCDFNVKISLLLHVTFLYPPIAHPEFDQTEFTCLSVLLRSDRKQISYFNVKLAPYMSSISYQEKLLFDQLSRKITVSFFWAYGHYWPPDWITVCCHHFWVAVNFCECIWDNIGEPFGLMIWSRNDGVEKCFRGQPTGLMCPKIGGITLILNFLIIPQTSLTYGRWNWADKASPDLSEHCLLLFRVSALVS